MLKLSDFMKQTKEDDQSDFNLNCYAINKSVTVEDRRNNDDLRTVDDVRLCDEQLDAVDEIINGSQRVTVLTGCAGAGKSVVIKALHEWYRRKVTLCATTGRAALNIRGSTIDSVFAINRRKWTIAEDRLNRSMSYCGDTIIVDEASMIGNRMARLVWDAIEFHNKKIVLVGDWAQAAPVNEDWPFREQLFQKAKFIKLRQNHRQHDGPYLDALNEIRVGRTSLAEQVFADRCTDICNHETTLRMFAFNDAVNSYNIDRLREFCTADGNDRDIFMFRAEFEDKRPTNIKAMFPKRESDVFEQAAVAHGMPATPGCRVMIVRNGTDENYKKYANGDTGVIEDAIFMVHGKEESFADGYRPPNRPVMPAWVLVKLDRGATISMKPHVLETTYMDKVDTVITGYPLRLGYACTVHKAQGATVDKAWVAMRTVAAMSQHGLAYVALSRTRTLEGLTMDSFIPSAVMVSEEVAKWL